MKILSLNDYCEYIREELDIDAVPLKQIFDDIEESSLSENDALNILTCIMESRAVPIYSPYSNKGHEIVSGFSNLLKMTTTDDYKPLAEKLYKMQKGKHDIPMGFSFFIKQ